MKKKLLSALFFCCILITKSNAQSWATTGNSGTSSTTNFIGTKDKQALVFRANNTERMRILTNGNLGIGTNSALQKLDVVGNINIRSGFGLFIDNHRVLKVDSAKANTFLGNGAGINNTTGIYNTASGYGSLYSNTTGNFNTATGGFTLVYNTTGIDNTASGYASLYSNTTGSYNTASGWATLYYNSTGFNNTASGFGSLYYNTSGFDNNANGYSSLYSNTTGFDNTATGSNALYSNSTGVANTANGVEALYFNSTGGSNTASGFDALYHNTIGIFNTATGVNALRSNATGNNNTAGGVSALVNNTTGNDNTANGVDALYGNSAGVGNTASGLNALYYNSNGYYNTANGVTALLNNTAGSYNTAVGTNALYNNTGSYYNTAVGYLALGFSIDPGWNNTAVGSFAGPADGLYNTVTLGEESFASASNQARIGNSSTTSIGGYASWTNISDGRVKKNIKENVPGLAFINKLKPLTYNLDLNAADKIIQSPVRKDKTGKTIQPQLMEVNARNEKEQIVYTGFVAQDVEKAAKELNYNFSGVDAAKSSKDLYGLRYAEFVVPLVKAVQELSKDNDDLRSTLSDVVAQLAEVKKQLEELKILKSTPGTQSASGFARLEQNVPNPFNGSTAISYYIPSGASRASLTISNANGQILKTILLNSKGAGKTSISSGELAAGNYFYTLFIDGKKTETKQMVLTK